MSYNLEDEIFYSKKDFMKILHKNVVNELYINGFVITEIQVSCDEMSGNTYTTICLEYNRYEFNISYEEPGSSFKKELENLVELMEDGIESYLNERGFQEEIIDDLKNVIESI